MLFRSWYGQAVYQFAPAWRTGYRYDRLNAGRVDLALINNGTLSLADLPIYTKHNPTRNSLMVDYKSSEFGLVRLQVAADKSRQGVTDNQVFLQYIMSMGAHGAHKY